MKSIENRAEIKSIPEDIVIAITDKCNGRCSMCNIWKLKSNNDLPIKTLSILPTSLKDINISGGEPFLRADLVDIIKVLTTRCPNARLIISSNGILTRRILAVTEKAIGINPKLGIAISVDGRKDVHDRIRGIVGVFDRSLATIEGLKKLGLTNLRLAFTATKSNVMELVYVYGLANSLGVQFSCSIAHNSGNYFRTSENAGINIEELKKQLSIIASSELKTLNLKKWLRAYFYGGLVVHAQGKSRILPCLAGTKSLFLDADSTIYPCNVLNISMGKLVSAKFEETWESDLACTGRAAAAKCRQNCWMICTARVAIKQSMPSVASWVLKNKIRAHFRRQIFE